MKKICAMQIFESFLHNFWKKIINYIVYFYNQIFQKVQNWKTSYEVFYLNVEKNFFRVQKRFQIIHLKIYNYRVYIMTRDAQLKKNQKWKLNSHVYINYLVNYNFTNIFRVWISHKDEVIFTQNVIFDEHTYFDDKSESLFSQMIVKMNSLIT